MFEAIVQVGEIRFLRTREVSKKVTGTPKPGKSGRFGGVLGK